MGLAFNGASIGGVLFVPLWIFLIGQFGFRSSAASVGTATIIVVGLLSVRYFSQAPDVFDGRARPRPTLSRLQIFKTPKFLTLSAAFSLGLFAQIGLLAHLIVRLTPEVGVEVAGLLVSAATICAVVGRTRMGW